MRSALALPLLLRPNGQSRDFLVTEEAKRDALVAEEAKRGRFAYFWLKNEEICPDLCVSGLSAERDARLAGAGFVAQSGIRF